MILCNELWQRKTNYITLRLRGAAKISKQQLMSTKLIGSKAIEKKDTWNKLEIAVCPKCRQEHEILIHWIGRGVPKIYCPDCKDVAERTYIPNTVRNYYDPKR